MTNSENRPHGGTPHRRFLIGLDAGGGSGRCLLVDIDSRAITSTWRRWQFPVAPGTEGWGYDLHLETMWQLLGEAVQEAMQRARANPDEVLGIAVTSMRHTLVLLDRHGQPLLAVPNRDARAANTGLELAAERGSEFYQRTGRWPSAVFIATRLAWLAGSRPEILAQASLALSLSEWITLRLCGQPAADYSQAAESMLLDIHQSTWAKDLITSLGAQVSIFPPLSTSGTRLAALTPTSAAQFGLKPGTPVALGGADTQCGLLGAGAVRPGQMGVIAGTTTPLQLVMKKALLDTESRLWTGMHVVPGMYVLESNAGGMGDSLEWISRLLYPTAPQPTAMLDAEASLSMPGAAGLVSTFGSQVFNGKDMTLPLGFLSLSHLTGADDASRRQYLARAILEGLAYATRANAEQISTVSASATLSHPEVFLAGGMSRSRVWSQILADVLQQPVTVAITPDASALGAAICAGVGAGTFKDLAEGSNTLAGTPRQVTPRPEYSRVYQELYDNWSRLRATQKDAEALAADFMLQGILSSRPSDVQGAGTDFRPSLLVTAQMDETALARLRRIGDVEYANYRESYRVLTGDDLVEAMQGKHILITEVDVVDAEVLSKLPELKLIASCRGNAVNIDIEACTAYKVPVLNTPGRNADAVADLTVAFMLMLARKLVSAVQFLHDPEGEAGDLARMGAAYSQFQGVELWRRTVGLIGMGAIGQRVIQRLLPFGARVLVYDPYVTPEQATLAGAQWAPLETLLRESDFVSLHAPSNAETAGLLGAEQFAMMKPGAFLVNTARAALTDEDALYHALQSGHMGGAALDVFAAEPPGPQDALLTLPNVIATPHLGGNTEEVAAHQGEIIATELERFLSGEKPRYLLNPQALSSFSWKGTHTPPSTEVLAQLRSSGGPAVSDLDAKPRQSRSEQSPQPSPAQVISPPEAQVTTNLQQPSASPDGGEATAKGGFLSGLKSLFGGGKPSSADQAPTAPSTPPSAIPPSHSKGSQSAMLDQILRKFLTACEKDPALLDFAANRIFSMHYVLTDAALEFHMVFENGSLKADLGGPGLKPDLTLKMKAEIFDGMMTGRINATAAAMSGKMKFSGDTSKAMAMQRIQKDIMRLYSASRSEVGDPGDLTQLSSASAPSPAQTPATPATPQTTAYVPHVDIPQRAGDERDELVQTIRELYEKNLITATGGNLSVRVSGKEDQLWITPSAMFKGNLHPELMVRINMEGETLDEDAATPSSERWVHTEILNNRPDLNAVIHTHAPWATLLALSETPFLPISTEAAFIGDIPRVPFIMPGTRQLAEAVAQAIGAQGSVVLMQNHGLVVAGSSLRRAASTTEVIERYSELILRCLALGKQPPVLPPEAVQALKEMGKMMA